MNLRPLHDNVLVKRTEEEETSSGGIILSGSAKEKPSQGEVVAVGPGKSSDSGDVTAMNVSVGDTASSVSVPTQSVYLPNHPFKTGQQVTFTKPSGSGNIGVSSDGLVSSAFSIPESGLSQTLYVINKSDDFIGLVTSLISLFLL